MLTPSGFPAWCWLLRHIPLFSCLLISLFNCFGCPTSPTCLCWGAYCIPLHQMKFKLVPQSTHKKFLQLFQTISHTGSNTKARMRILKIEILTLHSHLMGLILRVWRKRRKKFSVEPWKHLGLVLDFFFFLPHISASLQLWKTTYSCNCIEWILW